MATIPQEIERAQYVSLSTFRRNGAVVATAVWFATEGDKIYFYSALDAGKMKRVRATGRVTVAPCDVRGKLAPGAALVTGVAAELPAEHGPFVHGLLDAKYGWKKRAMEFLMMIPEKLRIRKPNPDGFVVISLD